MKYNTLKEILYDMDDYNFEEATAKMGLNFHNIDDKDERVDKFADVILSNVKLLIKPYSKDTLQYLHDICTEKTVLFDMDYNTLICDGICYVEKENEQEIIKTTDDFKKSYLSVIDRQEIKEKIEVYDETERVIKGIIKTYAAISTDDLYDIFIDVKSSKEDEFNDEDEFEHFIYHRDGILNSFEIYEYGDEDFKEEYFIIDELDDPDEVINYIIASDRGRKILSRNDYLTFAVGPDYVTDQRALREFKDLIYELSNENGAQTEDIISTVMYDIKMGNLDDLMLDIMTYIEIESEDQHSQLKDKLSNLYEKTPTWLGEYLEKEDK